MATSFVIACPDCGKQVKVSEEHVGKKVKCKGCGTVYPVKAPGGAPAAARKGPPPTPGKAKATQAKVTKAAPPDEEEEEKAAPPPPADAPATGGYKFADDEDEDGPKQYTLAKTDDHLPRCPFCAKEMESHEAMICLHCGYNTRTRVRPEVKQVYAHSFGEIFLWLLPGILCILLMIAELVFFIIFSIRIDGWLEDTWIEDSKGPPVEYIGGLGPPFMRVYLGLIIVGTYVPLTRFAWKRLVKNNKPPETRIKDEWER